MTWIQIDGTVYLTDTDEEIAEAQTALVDAGQSSAGIFVGDPETQDAYANGQQLFA